MDIDEDMSGSVKEEDASHSLKMVKREIKEVELEDIFSLLEVLGDDKV